MTTPRVTRPRRPGPWILAIGLLAGGPSGGEEYPRRLADGWVAAEGEALLVNVTPAEARDRALRAAQGEAIAFALGIDVRSQDYLATAEADADVRQTFLSFSSQSSSGRIVARREPEWSTYEIPGDPVPVTVYRARIRVKVERQEGRADPGFAVQVALNKEQYVAGEEMRLAITATQPCHLTVINVTAVDTVVVLLPHQYRSRTFLAAGDTLRVPDAGEQAQGIRYRVTVPAGREQAVEWIKVIAMKKERALGQGWPRSGLYNQVPTHRAAVEQLMRYLVQVPRQEWTEADAGYRVVAAAAGSP